MRRVLPLKKRHTAGWQHSDAAHIGEPSQQRACVIDNEHAQTGWDRDCASCGLFGRLRNSSQSRLNQTSHFVRGFADGATQPGSRRAISTLRSWSSEPGAHAFRTQVYITAARQAGRPALHVNFCNACPRIPRRRAWRNWRGRRRVPSLIRGARLPDCLAASTRERAIGGQNDAVSGKGC